MGIRLAAFGICIALISACSADGTSNSPITGSPSPAPGTIVTTGLTCGPAATPPAGTPPVRVPLPANSALITLAVDGNGTAWFGDAGPVRRLACYRPGQAIREFPLDPDFVPGFMRSSPDGSVWFSVGRNGQLGRIGRDGVLSQVQTQVSPGHPGWGVAVGPDGSVWYDTHDSDVADGVSRLWPDGRTTTFPAHAVATITVDSHGNAWMPGLFESGGPVVLRVSDSGEVARYTLPQSVRQLAEASDGHMWFLNVGCLSTQQIGWIDANGQTKFFDANVVDDTTLPNAIVRAPDGAVWFGTSDGRLIRLVSETDVTVYSLPWSDAVLGQFVVLPGNHIVMVNPAEVLDFTAVNGTRAAGPSSIPGPPQRIAKDAAEGAAYAAAVGVFGPTAKIVLGKSWEGNHAALFAYQNPRCAVPERYVYVVEDSGVWREYDVRRAGQEYLPSPAAYLLKLRFRSGCLNVHASPSVASKVVTCLHSGSSVTIDQLPVYADGYMWWHVATRGWAIHSLLLCTSFLYATLPQC